MTEQNKQKIIHVDKLIVKANEVIIVDEGRRHHGGWGRPRRRHHEGMENLGADLGHLEEGHEHTEEGHEHAQEEGHSENERPRGRRHPFSLF